MKEFLFISSTIIYLVAALSYIFSIVKGGTKPHRVTRFVLLVVSGLNLGSIIYALGNLGAIAIATIFFLQSIVIMILSIARGLGGANRFDITCLIIALLGLIGWKITNNPVIGITFAVIADLVAYLPAFVKTWQAPETESSWFYLLGGVAALLSLFAYDITVASTFQIYLVVSCLIMMVCIYHKKLFSKRLR